jgi:hypothetical protein
MPIEVKIIPRGKSAEIMGEVQPGKAGSIADHSSDSHTVISFICNEDDAGGRVYKIEDEGIVRETDETHYLDLSQYTKENLEGVFGAGGSYQRKITEATGKIALLVLTHLPSK